MHGLLPAILRPGDFWGEFQLVERARNTGAKHKAGHRDPGDSRRPAAVAVLKPKCLCQLTTMFSEEWLGSTGVIFQHPCAESLCIPGVCGLSKAIRDEG